MSYGEQSLTDEQKRALRQSLNTNIAAEDQIRLESSRDEMLQSTAMISNEEYALHMSDRRDEIMAQINAGDTFADRLKMSEAQMRKSTWLAERKIPKQKEMGDKIQEANQLFGFGTLSDSQKAKRGKKFTEKAERQAKMIRELKLHQEGRNAAFDAVMTETIPNAVLEKEQDEFKLAAYLKDTSHLNDTEDMMNDISFYAVWRQYALKNEDKEKVKGAAEFIHQLPEREMETNLSRVRNLTDSEAYKDEYVNILLELEKLDVDLFNYKDDAQFIQNYSCKLAALRMYSHGEKMLKVVGNDKRIKSKVTKLQAKTEVIKEIIKDYENRALLIQSPYYVLLAGKNVEGLSEEDLKTRLENTDDDAAREFIQKLLERRRSVVFKKGDKASDMLKKAEKRIAGETKAFHKENHEADKKLMDVRDGILDKYRKRAKKSDPSLSDADVDVIAIQRYIQDRAMPYEEFIEYDEKGSLVVDGKIKSVDPVYGRDIVDLDYYTILDKHPAFNYEKHFIEEKPFLDLGDGVSEDDINMVYHLNRRLASTVGKYNLAGGLLDGRTHNEYYHALAELAVYRRKCEFIKSLDKDWAEDDPDGNEAFSKEDRAKRKALKAAVEKSMDIIKNDWYYQDLCKQVLDSAKTISDMLYERYLESSTPEIARQALLDSTKLAKPRAKYNYSKLKATSVAGTPLEKDSTMPEEFPMEMAIKENEAILGRKLTEEELNDLKATYEDNYKSIEEYRKTIDDYFNEREAEQKKYSDIDGAGAFRDEWTWVEALPMEDRRPFMEAVAKYYKKGNVNSTDEAVIETLKTSLRKILDYCKTIPEYDFEYTDTKSMMKNYAGRRFRIEMGFTMMKALSMYRSIGGQMDPDETEQLNVICHTFSKTENSYRNQCLLAVCPESMLISKEAIDATPTEKLWDKYFELEHQSGDLNSKINEQKELIKTAEEKLRRKEDDGLKPQKIEEEKVKLDRLIKEKAEIDRRYKYIEVLATERAEMEASKKLTESKPLGIMSGVKLKDAMEHNTKHERYQMDKVYKAIGPAFKTGKKKLDDRWKLTEQRPAASLIKLAYLGANKKLLSEITSTVEINEQTDYSKVGPIAVKGLLYQFSNESGKRGYLQFGNLAKPYLRSGASDLGRDMAAHENIMNMAHDLEGFLQDSGLKKEVLSGLSKEERKMYDDIISFSEATLPMIDLVNEEGVSAEEKKKRLDAMHLYMQSLAENAVKLNDISQNGENLKWFKPNGQRGYMDFYNSINH